MKGPFCFVLLLLLSCAVVAQQPGIAPSVLPQQGASLPPGPPSPVVHKDGSITFSLLAPSASSVGLDGDYPIGNGFRSGKSVRPMTQDDKGVWSITVEPLKPEIYNYHFLVDGVATPDPHNKHTSGDGGHVGSWAVVPGAGSSNYLVNDVPHGVVREMWYPSPTLGKKARRLMVYTPPGYDAGTARYPVFYLLHGGSGDEESWLHTGRAPEIFDNLIAQGKMVPMIVAIYNGNAGQSAAPGLLLSSTTENSDGIGNWGNNRSPEAAPIRMAAWKRDADAVTNDLIPFMDKNFRTKADAADRAIAGFSGGATAALYTAFTHFDAICWVGVFSSGMVPDLQIDIPMPADAAKRRGPDVGRSFDPVKFVEMMPTIGPAVSEHIKLLFITMGGDDGLLEFSHDMYKLLDQKGVKYVASEIPGYGHEWPFWRINLVDFSQRLFKDTARQDH